MRLRAPLLLAASFALLTLSSSARAQGVPPDVVKLRDGSMFRGTIAELVANDHVDLMMANGQTRRFLLKDVTFAGSAAAAQPTTPPPPPPPPGPPPSMQGPQPMVTVNAQRAELRIEANEPDVQFQLRTGQSEVAGVGWGFRSTYSFVAQENSYTTICTAPCSASIPTGSHRIGLSHDGRGVIEADEPVLVTGAGMLHGTYTSHAGIRVAGLLLNIASVAAGITLMVTAIHEGGDDCSSGTCDYQSHVNGTQMAFGVGILVVGSLAGTVLMLQRDTAEISFVPMTPMASSGSKELATLRTPGVQPEGMSLQLRF